ncbi:MAG: PASTA domain-containing protein [Flavobacterium sp.]|nr:PASTA domain-containing protein [Flavobacterium sp.]
MSLRKYLTSKVFFAQLLAAMAIVGLLAFFFFHWITYVTKHNEEIMVPNLKRLTTEQAEEKLDELGLEYEILDTLDFKPNLPKLSVVLQEPEAGELVKGGRTVYLKINASSYKMVRIPDLVDKTYRQAVPTLISLGLAQGNVSYAPHIGKDMVLEMRLNGKKLKPGTKVYKATKIDLVLGDGAVVFDESDADSLRAILPEPEVLPEEEIKDSLKNGQ